MRRDGANVSERRPPATLAEALASYLKQSGFSKRLQQAGIVEQWSELVGPQIARVTQPLSVTQDGLLFVAVTTHGWMAELSMLEPELLRKLNTKPDRKPVTRIRWMLQRA